MADLPISGLPAVVTPATTDEFATAQGGTSKKYTGQQIIDLSILNNSQTNTISGPWASAQSFDLEFTLIDGKKVILGFPTISVAATTSAIATVVTTIPPAFRPSSHQRSLIAVKDNGQNMIGVIRVDTAGEITISVNPNLEPFTGASGGGTTGAAAQTFTYDLNT